MFAVLLATTLLSGDALVSGPQPGSKFGPYTFLLATGPNRGTLHCYVCETGADPAVIVFARTPTETLGQFLQQLDRDLAKQPDAKLHAWVTFVGLSQQAKDAEISNWSKKLGLRNVPLGICEDEAGPPSYHLNRDADLTILLVKQNKVVQNLSFRQNAFTGAEVKKAISLLLTITTK
jgi:hypothetical protein